MSSIYPKFLWSITIDSDNNDFRYNKTGVGIRSATLTSGDYDSILEVGAELETQLNNADSGWTVSVSQLGIISLTNTSFAWTNSPFSCDADILTLLGFDTTETVSSGTLTANDQHTHGYYPGLLSYGRRTYSGVGITMDRRWLPDWSVNRTKAGNGENCIVGVTSPIYTRDLSFGIINSTELEDSDIGLTGFWNNCIASQFRFYEDRSDGTVDTPGTKNTDYYLCTLDDQPRIQPSRGNANYWSFSLILNKE